MEIFQLSYNKLEFQNWKFQSSAQIGNGKGINFALEMFYEYEKFVKGSIIPICFMSIRRVNQVQC